MKIDKIKVLGATILVASVFASVNASATNNSVENSFSKENITSKIKEMRDSSFLEKKNQEDHTNFQIKMGLLFGGILALAGVSFALINKQSQENDGIDCDLSAFNNINTINKPKV